MLKIDVECLNVWDNGYTHRYLGNGCTSMAVVEVELPTGYQPCESLVNDASDPLCLRDVCICLLPHVFIHLYIQDLFVLQILGSDSNDHLDKYEVTGKSVVFYFDHVRNQMQTLTG